MNDVKEISYIIGNKLKDFSLHFKKRIFFNSREFSLNLA